MKKKKLRIFIIPAAMILLLGLILPGFYQGLTVRRYELDYGLAPRKARLVLITDLHSCAYGDGMKKLIDAVKSEEPDVILLGGDIFDDRLGDENAKEFLAGIAASAPCYYVTGNHEYWKSGTGFDGCMAYLDELGIVRLSGTCENPEIGGLRLSVCGVDDPCAWTGRLTGDVPEGFGNQLRSAASRCGGDTVSILLTHRPELFELYGSFGFDLILSGHAHGGQWRVPGLLNGLYAPNQGWFPALAGGRYEEDGTVMIVSRGLARESTRVPRFYNPPELVVIDLK